MKNHYRAMTLIIAVFLQAMQSITACTTPVYQYAMERWKRDYYQATLVHKGPLTGPQSKALNNLQDALREGTLNMWLKTIDMESDTTNVTRLMKGIQPKGYPFLALWYPREKGRYRPFWTGRLNEATISQILHFPILHSLIDGLIQGNPAVWIYIPSGNAEKDRKAHLTLQKELNSASEKMVQENGMGGPGKQASDSSLRFSMITIDRTDPAATFLITMLTAISAEITSSPEPLAFPVFGRGRVLCKVKGQDIKQSNIHDINQFLINPCACQIKAANPGMDLITRANWDQVITGYDPGFVQPKLSGVMPDTNLYNPEDEDIIDLTQKESIFRSKVFSRTGILIGSLFIIIALASVFIVKRR